MSLDMTWVEEHYEAGSGLHSTRMVCKTCGQPSWHVTRHAAERHGSDVDVMPAKVPRPDWMTDEWIQAVTTTVDLPAEISKAWQDHRKAQLAGHQATADGLMRRIDALLDMVPRPHS